MEPYLCCGRDSDLNFVGSKTLGISECRVPRSDLSYPDSAVTPSTDSWVSFKPASRWAVIVLYWMLQDSGAWVSTGTSALSPSLQLVWANVLLGVPAGVMGKLGKGVYRQASWRRQASGQDKRKVVW